MNFDAKISALVPDFSSQTQGMRLLAITRITENRKPFLWDPVSYDLAPPQKSAFTKSFQKPQAPSIYAVDDVPHITELYAKILQRAGYAVKTFNDRPQALSALKADHRPPVLLVTDYRGLSMPITNFIRSCRLVRPGLGILMASGFNQTEMRFFGCAPDRFIQKPFSAEELRLAVEAALATR